MAKFKVVSNIQMNGKLYEAGATIELSEKQAAEMPWAVEVPVAAPAAPPPPAKFIFIAAKEFQFNNARVKEGEALQLTEEEAAKLGPEKVRPEEPEEPKS